MSFDSLKLKPRYYFNAFATTSIINLLKKKVIEDNNVHLEYKKPSHKTFILISNHTEALDPGYEMAALKRYIRYVSSDHAVRLKGVGPIFKHVGGVIIKHRDKPSQALTDEIIRNLRAGIPVGLHAEGAMTTNGQTGYISEHTGQLVKDAGVALVTYRFVGGYLRKPRWANKARKGPITGHFVAEYSPEELAKLSVKEITELIRRDTYVNAYEQQRMNPQDYRGEDLAECVERMLYICPKCGQISTLHSKGNFLNCDCGYSLEMKSDGFFHSDKEVIFDNVLDWDLWQRDEFKKKVLSAGENEVIFTDKGESIKRIKGEEEELLCENATVRLFKDRFELEKENGEIITVAMDKIIQVNLANKDSVFLVDKDNFYELNPKVPRAPTKYIAAWRYLTGREYY